MHNKPECQDGDPKSSESNTGSGNKNKQRAECIFPCNTAGLSHISNLNVNLSTHIIHTPTYI